MNQRWEEGRSSFRPAEPIRTSEYEVAELLGDSAPRAFVERHHYAASYPAARLRAGLFHRGELVGVAVFSHPCNDAVLLGTFPALATAVEAIELGRFVLLDEVPGNGESWFLARCFELLRGRGLRAVLSFSDPVARSDASGRIIFPGHVGTIYQAHNGRFLGRGAANVLRLLPDGRVFHRRAMQKIRAAEKGWSAAAALLAAHGAAELDPSSDSPARLRWLHEWLPRVTRPLRHPGNLKYAWALDRRVILSPSLPYPKRKELAA